MTNFGDNRAYQAGARPGPRGVMGNAQTHCVQLPNIFAFARGAAGKPVSEADYVAFANDLISGKGQEIVGAWKALSGTDSSLMRAQAAVIRKAAAQKLETGRLRGLLFGDPARFLIDVVMQLELKAAYEDFLQASGQGVNVKPTLSKFFSAAEAWQRQTAYQGRWSWPGLYEALDKLNSPEINSVLSLRIEHIPGDGVQLIGRGDLTTYLEGNEEFTTKLLTAIKKPSPECRSRRKLPNRERKAVSIQASTSHCAMILSRRGAYETTKICPAYGRRGRLRGSEGQRRAAAHR